MRLRRFVVPVLLGLVAIVAGWAWAWSSPPGSAPDDDYHLASIWCPPPAATSGCPWKPGPDGSAQWIGLPSEVALTTCYGAKPTESASCLNAITPTLFWTERFDKGDYPGPYYQIMHVFAGDSISASVMVIRMVNVMIAVVLLGGAAWAMSPRLRPVASVGIFGSIVPLGAFIIASTNPSSWAITGISAAALGLIASLAAESRTPRIAGASIAILGAAIAAMARSDSGLFLGMVMFSVAVLFVEKLRRERWTWLVFGAITAAAAWALTHGAQAGVQSFGSQRNPSSWSLLFHNLSDVASIPAGVYGLGWGLGWLDTKMPTMVSVPALAAAAGIAVIGLGSMSVRKVLALCSPVAAAVLLPLVMLQRGGEVVGEAVQPRYVLSAVMLGLFILMLHRSRDRAVAFSRGQILAIVVALAGAHGLALFTNIRRYVTGDDVWSPNLEAQVEWWWPAGPGPVATFVLGAVAFAALLGMVWWSMTRARRQVVGVAGEKAVEVLAGTPGLGPDPKTVPGATEVELD